MERLSYLDKDFSYYNSHRDDVFNVLKDLGIFNRALEIGCGNGSLLHSLKQAQIIKYSVGVDPYGRPHEKSNLDEFFSGTVEDILPKIKEKFDVIIFADVLEHLEDPWQTLRNLTTDCLNDGGHVIISIPNFRNIWTLSKIIFTNSFKYEIEGVLDKTHLRFFCKKDLEALVKNGGLQLQLITPNFKHKESVFFSKNRLRYVNIATLNLFPFWITDQMIAVGKKK
jgi:2-polyprenyl-3-methyl-5-hydroxy-6-metoxy-1,4-benzoquinol methylase